MEMRLLRGDEMALFYDRDLDDAFPGAELKPLRVMEDARQTGKYHPWGLFDGEDLVGGAFTWEYAPGWVLFDYLCGARHRRNDGLGAELIRRLADCERGKVLFGETEVPDCAPDPEMARRRLAFYLRNGAREAGYDMTLFGVPYRTIYWAEEPHSREEIMARHSELYRLRLREPLYGLAVQIPWTIEDGVPPKLNWKELEDKYE